MNYNHLYHFHIVASEGTLARAAKKLGISQPTLSAQIRQLEEHFGKRLFDRTSGNMRLNANGRKALEITGDIFRLGEKLHDVFPANHPRVLARLEIGISTTVARSFAADRLVKLFANREILTRVRQGDHEYMYHELLTSGLDLFITDSPPDRRYSREAVCKHLSSPEFVVIAPGKSAKLLAPGFPKSLQRQPFVHYSVLSTYRFAIDQYLREEGVEPDVVAEADDVYLIREAVAAGTGIGVVPRAVAEEVEDKNIAILGPIRGPFDIFAVYCRKDPTKEVLAALDILGGGGGSPAA